MATVKLPRMMLVTTIEAPTASAGLARSPLSMQRWRSSADTSTLFHNELAMQVEPVEEAGGDMGYRSASIQ